ncbi:MAG TPA: DUF3854 domain-containing protein [Rhodothermales bacterium]|nr:DUF3854 domain-containing protein [Rhodothermales bacterium]
MNEPSGSYKKAADDGWLHHTGNSSRPARKAETKPEPRLLTTSERTRRDVIFTTLLEELVLTEQHANNLLFDRGLSPEAITRNLYASVTETLGEVVAALASEGDLTGVPGFYFERGSWRFMAKPGDLLIPVRDEQGRIQAISRRVPDYKAKRGDGKYPWCSHPQSRSGTPVHVANPYAVKFRPQIIISEGALKSDIISDYLGLTVVGIAGVDAIGENFGAWLRRSFPEADSIQIAFDMDMWTNKRVSGALDRLLKELKFVGYSPTILVWDRSAGKGLDEVLAAGVAA